MIKLSYNEEAINPVFGRLLENLPQGTFIEKRATIVPFTRDPVHFILETDFINQPVRITLTRRNALHVDVRQYQVRPEFDVVPTSFFTTIDLVLGHGYNEIKAESDSDRSILGVHAEHYASLFHGYADEIYKAIQREIDNQNNAIFSDYATRLAEPVITFQNFLPDIDTLKLLATKVTIRSLVNEPASQTGVTDITKGLTHQTSVLHRQRNVMPFLPAIYPLYRQQEDFSGTEIHYWYLNSLVATWVTFIRMCDNLDFCQILKISEYEVAIRYNPQVDDLVTFTYEQNTYHGVVTDTTKTKATILSDGNVYVVSWSAVANSKIERYRFDFDLEGANFLRNQLKTACWDNLRITDVFLKSRIWITLCPGCYPFDQIVSTPLDFDEAYPWAVTNDPPSADPENYQYTDLNLSQRFDGGGELDCVFRTNQLPLTTCDSWLSLFVEKAYINLEATLPLGISATISSTAPGAFLTGAILGKGFIGADVGSGLVFSGSVVGRSLIDSGVSSSYFNIVRGKGLVTSMITVDSILPDLYFNSPDTNAIMFNNSPDTADWLIQNVPY